MNIRRMQLSKRVFKMTLALLAGGLLSCSDESEKELQRTQEISGISFDVTVSAIRGNAPSQKSDTSATKTSFIPLEGGDTLDIQIEEEIVELFPDTLHSDTETRAAVINQVNNDFHFWGDSKEKDVRVPLFKQTAVSHSGVPRRRLSWPGRVKELHYWAVYPVQSSSTTYARIGDKQSPVIRFKVDADVTRQQNLLVAQGVQQYGSGASGNVRIPLTFNHALTAVKFKLIGSFGPEATSPEKNSSPNRVESLPKGFEEGQYSYIAGTGATYGVEFMKYADDPASRPRDLIIEKETSTGDASSSVKNIRIVKIELANIYAQGAYSVETGEWEDLSSPQTFSTPELNVDASRATSAMITDNEYTFLMIPQTLPQDAKVVVHLSDGTSVSAPIGGRVWSPSREITYRLGRDGGTGFYLEAKGMLTPYDDLLPEWKRLYESSPNNNIFVNQTHAIQVKSYAKSGSGTVPMEWEVVGFDANGDGVFTLEEKPVWVVGLDKTAGSGVNSETLYETISVANNPEQKSMLRIPFRGDSELRSATPLGSQGAPFDLSLAWAFGSSYNVNIPIPALLDRARYTANCYPITRPGYYRIPLVYGNAIEKGEDNKRAYTSTKQGEKILSHFVDHADRAITSPYINVQNAASPAVSAEVVWSTVWNVVTNLKITGSGAESYLDFEVPRENLYSGNAVVAVKDAAGTILWSWHLWFRAESPNHVSFSYAPHSRVSYNASPAPVGHNRVAFSGWDNDLEALFFPYIEGSNFSEDLLIVPVKVAMKGKSNITAICYIQRRHVFPYIHGSSRVLYGWPGRVGYQFGRKDPVPPASLIAQGNFSVTYKFGEKNIRETNIGAGIQHPDRVYGVDPVEDETIGFYTGSSYLYGNLWDANYVPDHRDDLWSLITKATSYTRYNREVLTKRDGSTASRIFEHTMPVKTIYDPTLRGNMVLPTELQRGFPDLPNRYQSFLQAVQYPGFMWDGLRERPAHSPPNYFVARPIINKSSANSVGTVISPHYFRPSNTFYRYRVFLMEGQAALLPLDCKEVLPIAYEEQLWSLIYPEEWE